MSHDFSSSAATEKAVTAPVKVEHTQLLINGQFVDAASGLVFSLLHIRNYVDIL